MWHSSKAGMAEQVLSAAEQIENDCNSDSNVLGPETTNDSFEVQSFFNIGINHHFIYGQLLEYSEGQAYAISGHVFIPEVSISSAIGL